MMPPGSHGRHQNVQEAADGVGGDLGIWDVWGFLGEGRAGWAIALGLITLKNVLALKLEGLLQVPGTWAGSILKSGETASRVCAQTEVLCPGGFLCM